MLFLSIEDFFDRAARAERPSPEEANEYARLSRAGDAAAKERLVVGFLYLIAAPIRRMPPEGQKLSTVYAILSEVERVIDCCDFSRGTQELAGYVHLFAKRQITRRVADTKL